MKRKTAALTCSVLADCPASAALLTMRFNQKNCLWLNFICHELHNFASNCKAELD